MKKFCASRRAFLKLSVLSATALAVPLLVDKVAPPDPAFAAEPATTHGPQTLLQQPSFNGIASSSPFGAMTDLSMGWDGTLWGVDTQGAPCVHDPIQDTWQPFGEGIDAAAAIGTTVYLFKGSQYVTALNRNQVQGGPVAIGTTWPTIPDSFKLSLSGAATVAGKLFFFKGGWYVPADGSAAPAKLTSLANWPQTAVWADGLFDAVFSTFDGSGNGVVYLFRQGQYILANFQGQGITQGPQPISSLNLLPSDFDMNGVDAICTVGGLYNIFRGVTVYLATRYVAISPAYLARFFQSWPATWHPELANAPSGREGNLWASVAGTQQLLQHDGESWQVMPGLGPSVSVGQDGSVYVVGTDAGLYRWNGTGYDGLGLPTQLSQVSIGDDEHAWALGANGAVYRYLRSNNTFAQVNLGAGVPAPNHISANADGSLWHCNAGTSNAFRLIPEASAPSEPVVVKGGGIVSGVQRVASTGFGAAHCLVSQGGAAQVYRYDSPYVFKTANAYSMYNRDVIVRGLGLLYLIEQTNLNTPNTPIQSSLVALDAHTGVEVARTQPLPSGWIYSDVTFDPSLELLYVGTAPTDDDDGQTQAQLLALDARTLQTVWAFTQASDGTLVRGIDSAPALNGNLLAFGDRSGNLIVLDTQQSLAQARQNQPIVELTQWQVSFTLGYTSGPIRIPTPVFMAGRVYGVIHNIPNIANSNATLRSAVFTHNTRSFLFDQTVGLPDVVGNTSELVTVVRRPAVIVSGYHPVAPETPMLAVNRYSSVAVVDPSNVAPVQTYTLPSGYINTGLTFDNGIRAGQQLSTTPVTSAIRLWFCDSLGNLWGLGLGSNNQWAPQNGTPHLVQPNTPLCATPTLHKDSTGSLTVLFGMLSIGTNSNLLFGYDPDTGNLASLPTGQTAILALSRASYNGVVYAGGIDLSNFGNVGNAASGIPQVFSIRVDTLTQALRDFVIDSQMMQDPDESAPGGDVTNAANPIPPSRARYQTHLTIIDNDPANAGSTAGMPYEPVKIWADTPMSIQVDGITYAIGPADAQFASVKTGVDGSLVITSGYANSTASDVPDLYAPALRVWAGFMNPYERIIITPDHEFHQRIALAHANAADDNPDKPNLVTATSYAGRNGAKPAPLFSNAEVSAGQPANCALAIGQMRAGVGFGGSGTSTVRRAVVQAAPTYLAYSDIGGAGYFPNNASFTRAVAVQQATGLAMTKPQGQPTTAASTIALSHTDAQSAIDALPAPTVNPPWEAASAAPAASALVRYSQGVRGIQRQDNLFKNFWDWLKKTAEAAVVEVTHIIVSVATDVLVGIRILVNGVEQVFKAVVKVLDDIASAIGAFFTMLAKGIEDVVAALSVFFEFGQIIQTHAFLKTEFLARVDQLKTSVADQIAPAVDGFFSDGETAIENAFNTLRSQINGQAIQQQPRMGSTAHTALTVPTSTNGTSNQAVKGMWAAQKLKAGVGSAATSTPSKFASKDAASVQDPAQNEDPLSTFIDGFVASLTGTGDLASVFDQLKADAGKLLTPGSVKQFFQTVLVTLLDVLELLMVGALKVGQALADGLLKALPGVLDLLFDATTGVLTATIDIPVLSWLYQKVFGAPLSFLDVMLLVTAIPVTAIYRIAEGHWPSQDITPSSHQSVRKGGQTQAVGTAAKTISILMGLFSGIGAMVAGIVNFLNDADEKPPTFVGELALTISTLMALGSFPVGDIGNWSRNDSAMVGMTVAIAILGFVGIKKFSNSETQKFMEAFVPVLTSGLNICTLGLVISNYVKVGGSGLAFAAGLISTLPGIINPLKLLGTEPARLVVGVVDGVAGFAVGALNLVVALTAAVGEVELPQRIFVPVALAAPNWPFAAAQP